MKPKNIAITGQKGEGMTYSNIEIGFIKTGCFGDPSFPICDSCFFHRCSVTSACAFEKVKNLKEAKE